MSKPRGPLVCRGCGVTFQPVDARRQFHSKSCAAQHRERTSPAPTGREHWNWKGGADYYRGPGWRGIRDRIRERDGWCCCDCGADRRGKKLDVHHLVPAEEWDRPGTANDDENLISLCPPCHSVREQGLAPERRRANWRRHYARNRERMLARQAERRAQRRAMQSG